MSEAPTHPPGSDVSSGPASAPEPGAELRECRERLRLLFSDNPFPMWVFDLETLRFLDVNQAAIRHYGWSRDEFLAMTIRDIRPADDLPRLQQVLQGGQAGVLFRGAHHHRTKDGRILDVEITTQEITVDGRNARAVMVIDQTERVRTERALRRSEERFRSLADATAQIVRVTSPEGEFVEEQPEWAAFTGQSYEQYRGYGWLDAIHPADRERTAAAWQASMASRAMCEVEYRLRRRDGEYRHMALRVVPVLEADGRVREWVGAENDVTERWRAESRTAAEHAVAHLLAEARTPDEVVTELLRAIGESLGWDLGALWRLDPDEDVLRCVGIWNAPDVTVDAFRQASWSLRLGRGQGLPGQVWEAGAPVWMRDAARDPSFLRRQLAADEGLHSAVAFPIHVAGEFHGVLEFFTRAVETPHPALLRSLQSIGSDIGQYLTRARAEVERDRLLRELDAERARLQEIFMQAPALIAVMRGPEHVLVLANQRYLQVVGDRPLLGRTVREAFQHLPDTGFIQLLDRVYHTGEPIVGTETPAWVDRGDGQLQQAYFNFVYQPLRDAAGRVEGILTHAVEVTDQVRARMRLQEQAVELEAQAEEMQHQAMQMEEAQLELKMSKEELQHAYEALRQSEERLSIAQRAGRVGVFDWSIPTGEVLWSEQEERLFGLEPGTFEGRVTGWSQRVHPDDLARVLAEFERCWRERRDETLFEFRIFWPDGSTRWITGGGRFFYGDDGEPLRMVGVNLDVTAERQARAEAEAANRAKTEFLSAMSHELRTPLNAIAGYVDLLDLGVRGPLTEAQRADLARIKYAQEHLLALINDILNYARIEPGRLAIAREPVPVCALIGEMESLLAPQLRAKSLAYTCEPCDPDLRAWGDRERVRQILLNLLSNAVKFTPAGGRIVLSAAVEDEHVLIRVTDTGRGIPPDKLAAIFEPFVQIDRGSSLAEASQQGIGLGLAISRELARAMDGEITVTSAADQGSSFSLVLPRAPETDDASPWRLDSEGVGQNGASQSSSAAN